MPMRGWLPRNVHPSFTIVKIFYKFFFLVIVLGLLVPWPRLIVTLLQPHDKPPWWCFLSLRGVPNPRLIKIRATLLTLAFYCDGDETVVLIAIVPVHPPGRRECLSLVVPKLASGKHRRNNVSVITFKQGASWLGEDSQPHDIVSALSYTTTIIKWTIWKERW